MKTIIISLAPAVFWNEDQACGDNVLKFRNIKSYDWSDSGFRVREDGISHWFSHHVIIGIKIIDEESN